VAKPSPEYISQFIKEQFPQYYFAGGENLVAFILAYYEWLETTDQSTKVLRGLQKNRDIDTATSDFLLNFKKIFLSGVKYQTQIDDRFMVKHVSDIYQSKGSTRSIELLLKMLYNEEVEVFLPSTRVTYASDSKFKKPVYIELSPSDRTRGMVGNKITGSKSGATAFIESVITKLVNNKRITIAYLSGVIGTFQNKEFVTDDLVLKDAPQVVGSLSNITITNGGQNFEVGDTFDVISSVGKGARAKVLSTEDATGKVSFNLANGGYGYTTSNAYTRSLSANATIVVSNIVNANTEREDFFLFEQVSQTLETVTYTSAGSNAALADYANGALVVGANNTNTNVATGYAMSAVAQTFIIQTESGSFADCNYIYVANVATNGQIDTVANSSTNGELIAQNSTAIGINGNNKPFYSHAKAFVRGLASNTYANVANVGIGIGADFEVGSIGTNETLTLFTDIIGANNTAASPKPFTNVHPNGANGGMGFIDSVSIDTKITIGNRANTHTPFSANGKFSNNDVIYEANVFVDRISLVAGGTGYSNSDTVTFSGATYGTQAAASVVTDIFGKIVNVPISNNGIQYRKQPSVAITTSTGSGANVYAIMDAQKIGATGRIKTTNTTVMFVNEVANGSFSNGDVITNAGVNAFCNAATAELARGTGYDAADTVTFTGGSPTTNANTQNFTVDGSGVIQSVQINDPGAGYSSNATLAINTSTGSGASLSPVMDFGIGLPKSGAADLTTILYNALTFTNFTIGTVESLNRINPGSNYNLDPLTVLHNPYVAGFNRRDLVAVVSNINGSFTAGETLRQTVSLPGYLITHSNSSVNGITLASNSAAISIGEGVIQLTTNATGVIESSNATHIKLKDTVGAFDDSYIIQTQSSGANVDPLTGGSVQQNVSAIATGTFKTQFANNGVDHVKIRRLKFGQAFANGATLEGLSSGSTATVENMYDDENTMPIGLNAVVTANVQTANGIATSLEILDSGFGYEQDGELSLQNPNTVFIVAGTANVDQQGVATGYWEDRRSFISDINKLHDSDYYQDYSYVTKTSLALEQYEEQLKDILHVAGNKLFGEVVKVDEKVALNLTASNSHIDTANAYHSWMN
tara:strand:- start:1763 stop:5059 length:3297 start_codon:yes stop_codon:yes gene_type:complete